MKKVFFGLVVFSFVFMGCRNINTGDSTPTKFEGTWKHWAEELNAVYIFTGNTWSFTADANDKNVPTGPFSGTFVFDESSITFTATSGGSATWTQPYSFKNNNQTFVLTNSTAGTMITRLNGDFNQQDTNTGDSTPTKFEGSWRNLYGSLTIYYTFTGSNFSEISDDGTIRSGTFTFTDTTITFTRTFNRDTGNPTDWTTTYQFKQIDGKEVLYLDGTSVGGQNHGDFGKQ